MKSTQAKAREFHQKTRARIRERDRGECIFCKMMYKMEGSTEFSRNIKSIMHYIPRSKNGLGIEQNGATGCEYHHHMLDNGAEGNRKEMMEIFKTYLQSFYPDWNEENLVYDKWNFLGGK